MSKEKPETLVIKIKPIKSISEDQIRSVMDSPAVKKYFKGSKYRVLSAQFFDRDKKEKLLGGCTKSGRSYLVCRTFYPRC